MTDERPVAHRKSGEKSKSTNDAPPKSDPAWALGLRDFYSSVVAEPLPDSFEDLMKQLEEADKKAQ